MKDGEIVKEYPTEVNQSQRFVRTRLWHRSVRFSEKWLEKDSPNPQEASNSMYPERTGTAQISQGAAGYKTGRTNYLVSFCGYFPSEAPKYSMIVSIQKPGLPASGGLMAGSVFSKIAERVYAKTSDYRLPMRLTQTPLSSRT